MAVKWENNVLGFVPQADWLNIPFNPTRPGDPADALFGDLKTNNITAQWESIAAAYQIPVMAQFHSFDVETQTTTRVPVDTHNIEKGLIKVKINQSERMRAILRAGVQNDALYDYVINDGINLADQVITRTKVAKNELLATGKVTIKENNLDLTVDYGVPVTQTQYTINVADGYDIDAQIQAIIDAATAIGVVINGMVTSRRVLTKMRKNEELQKAINGTYGAGALIPMSALEAHLATEFGITRVITNDLTYAADRTINSSGQVAQTTKRYYPADKITFFATANGDMLGTGLWGDPPEVDVQRFVSVSGSGVSPYVYVSQWAENDPTVLWTRASGLFMPVLYNPNSLFIAAVDDAEGTLSTISVASAAGTKSGDTALTLTGYTPASGESYVYKVGGSGEDAPAIGYHEIPDYSWTAWDGSADITATTGRKITVASINGDGKAVAAGSATVTAKP